MKRCIINVGCGGWYRKGTLRLIRSIKQFNFGGDIHYWINELPPGSPSHHENPYAFKVYAFNYALKKGFKEIMWLDSSCWFIQDPNLMFDLVSQHGYYLVSSGFNCAQTCNDHCLNSFGISRGAAEGITDVASGIIGLSFDHESSCRLFQRWERALQEGCFKGSRLHNPEESADPRFLFHRQDQSALGLSVNEIGGFQVDHLGHRVTYFSGQMPPTTIITLQGM